MEIQSIQTKIKTEDTRLINQLLNITLLLVLTDLDPTKVTVANPNPIRMVEIDSIKIKTKEVSQECQMRDATPAEVKSTTLRCIHLQTMVDGNKVSGRTDIETV